MPQEIPLGLLNRDSYVQQSNKVFPGRPTSYWFQRDIPRPVLNIWPAPFLQAEEAQLIVWRHRQIMDTENLQQEVEIPQRWLQAIVDNLASRVAAETQIVDMNLIPVLDQKATMSMQRAWDGDNDGSPTFINPGIGCYTK
jgi:PAS domain-containing protein